MYLLKNHYIILQVQMKHDGKCYKPRSLPCCYFHEQMYIKLIMRTC